jgi:hypothetical protein
MDRSRETFQLTAALQAKSTSVTLPELAEKGRARFQVIRAQDIAGMITETTSRLLREAEELFVLDPEALARRCQSELDAVLMARQVEASFRHDLEAEVARLQDELAQQREQLVRLRDTESLASQDEDANTAGELPLADMMRRVLSEMAEVRSEISQQASQAEVDPCATSSADHVAAALDKIASSIDGRLEKFGRTMGGTAGVEASDVKFAALFNQDYEAGLESNIEDVQLKKEAGAGIAGNLERLRKLRGTE